MMLGCFSCCMTQEKIEQNSLASTHEYQDTKALACIANISMRTVEAFMHLIFRLLSTNPKGHKFEGMIIHRKLQKDNNSGVLTFNYDRLPPIRQRLKKRTIIDSDDGFADSSKRRYLAEEIDKLGKNNISADIFTYHELSSSTQDFSPDNLLGEGGFGRVYKGHLARKEIDVAVKQLDRNGFQGNKEFLVEVLMLSLLHHPNLVHLVGYCAEGDQRILVYEHMANGSLEEHLLNLAPGKKPLDWDTRMKIAKGAAKGLEYLHETANPPVIYRDFKASNILLDGDFNPKLSDFGLAKIGPIGGRPHVSTRVMGTYGYCAPEYASTGQLTTKSDVYSFGVVFLEVISGRRVIDNSRPSEEHNLIEWAQPLFKDKKKFHLMADPLLEGKYPEKSLYQALAIAAMCLQEESSSRPLITDVVTALEFLSVDRNQAQNEEQGGDK